jgi:riboflavin biosynthesis pyrimidine reductase
MLEGGGRTNGGMLIDEVSLLVAPVADSRADTSAFVESNAVAPQRLRLESVEHRANDLLWLRYHVDEPDH